MLQLKLPHTLILFSLFFVASPAPAVADEIPGSRGLLSCDPDRNLELSVFLSRGKSRKKIRNAQALRMLSRFSETLTRASRDSERFLRFMEIERLSIQPRGTLRRLLKGRDLIRYNRVSGGLKVSRVPSASNLSLDQSPLDAYETLLLAASEIPILSKAIDDGIAAVKNCKGCLGQSLSRKAGKKGKKKKRCKRCTEAEYSATLAFRSGNYGVCACYNLVFVQWDERLTRKASSVSAVIDWTGGGQLERPTTSANPYDNEYSLGDGEPTVSVGSGQNWIRVADSYGVDFNFERCSPNCGPSLSSLMTFVQNPRIRVSCD